VGDICGDSALVDLPQSVTIGGMCKKQGEYAGFYTHRYAERD
jgi:hypothetical protein